MRKLQDGALSIVVPVYNEGGGLPRFHQSLINVLQKATIKPYEVIYIDDGSTDQTAELVSQWHTSDPNIKLISFSRNFG